VVKNLNSRENMENTSLLTMKPGETAKITGFQQGNKESRKRLLALGVTKQSVLTLIRVAPLKDPVEVQVNGSHLALRKEEAELLQLEALNS
jgi:ferrous iron transport protein A